MLKNKFLIVFLAILPAVALADAIGAIGQVTSVVNSWQAGAGAVAILLEALFRLVPTKKPLSWAWLVAGIFSALAAMCSAIANYMDRVLPQNVPAQDQSNNNQGPSSPPKS